MLKRWCAAHHPQLRKAILTILHQSIVTSMSVAPPAVSALPGTEHFTQVWRERIWKVIEPEFSKLFDHPTTRIEEKAAKRLRQKKEKNEDKKHRKERKASDKENDGDSDDPTHVANDLLKSKMKLTMEGVQRTSEARNVYMNLCWTGPCANTTLHKDIHYEKVANMVIDMFMDTSVAVSALAAGSCLGRPCSADDADHIDKSRPQVSLQESISSQSKRPWKIPATVEKGFEIPILVTQAAKAPEFGKFQRLGMDVVVNAVWLALYWAMEEQNHEAISALKKLILNWPMDFVMIQGNTPEEMEENMFKWSVNMSAKVERLRDFVGLENCNLLRIVAKTADIVKTKLGQNKKANAELVHKWLVTNVTWGTFGCPDVNTVQRHLTNWAAIEKNKNVVQHIESAVQRWGRNNLLDWPTKLQIVVTRTDASSIGYVVEALFCHLWRKNTADPYGAKELGTVIGQILWVRSYEKSFVKAYPAVFQCPPGCSDEEAKKGMAFVKHLMSSPSAFFAKTEGPDRDPTWLQSLPTEVLRSYMKHSLDLAQGFYAPEIKGALANVAADKYKIDNFHKGSRVSQRFFNCFVIAHDSLAGNSQAVSADAADSQDPSETPIPGSADGEAPDPASSQEQGKQPRKQPEMKELEVGAFQKECDAHCRRELEARMVALCANGTHVEINASVTSTRLYSNLTSAASVMGFYDVKNARVCNIYEGEGHRP